VFLQPVSPTQVTAMFDAKKQESQKGVSLIEMIFVIIILSVALVGIATTISGGTSRSSDTLVEIQSIALAQAYLDEIVGKRFDEGNRASGIPPCRGTLAAGAARRCSEEPEVVVTSERLFGPDGSEVRATYDDVDDYDGLVEGLGESFPDDTLKDANGADREGYDNYSVSIAVNYYDGAGTNVEYTGPTGEELDDMYDAKLITVTVFFGAETEGLVLSVYKSNF
jgi:MSHA pilin protein MshD